MCLTPPAVAPSELFQLLRDGRPRTRAQLAQLTGLARSTVAARVDTLMRLGSWPPTAAPVHRWPAAVAVRAQPRRARVVIGVDVGATHVRVVLTDLAGADARRGTRHPGRRSGPEAVLGWVRRR